jgi:hypothetical protein
MADDWLIQSSGLVEINVEMIAMIKTRSTWAIARFSARISRGI